MKCIETEESSSYAYLGTEGTSLIPSEAAKIIKMDTNNLIASIFMDNVPNNTPISSIRWNFLDFLILGPTLRWLHKDMSFSPAAFGDPSLYLNEFHNLLICSSTKCFSKRVTFNPTQENIVEIDSTNTLSLTT